MLSNAAKTCSRWEVEGTCVWGAARLVMSRRDLHVKIRADGELADGKHRVWLICVGEDNRQQARTRLEGAVPRRRRGLREV